MLAAVDVNWLLKIFKFAAATIDQADVSISLLSADVAEKFASRTSVISGSGFRVWQITHPRQYLRPRNSPQHDQSLTNRVCTPTSSVVRLFVMRRSQYFAPDLVVADVRRRVNQWESEMESHFFRVSSVKI